MPYWVHGRDNESGEPTDPFFTDAEDETVARAEATAQGIIVETVEPFVGEVAGNVPFPDVVPDEARQGVEFATVAREGVPPKVKIANPVTTGFQLGLGIILAWLVIAIPIGVAVAIVVAMASRYGH